MGLRITTWNVNGIRNPFGYEPWRNKRTFEAMFDILESDIVIMQETKIQRKDLTDDMVLVPGWDVYFSLPRHKKGYSGVAIYTRNATCAPIRAEEGITGILTPPNSTTSYCDLPVDQQIGGYPSVEQLADSELDPATIDCEGRCVILEFPAFVLIGVYCPANRDESRDEFRLGFLNLLDARVRSLEVAGKKVFLTGDLNIIREEMDTANAEEQLRKHGMTGQEYVSTPARRLFNQLIVGGKVIGERDEGREEPVLWDICRSFHPTRTGMFTCWEQKKNARPGNFGSRIDYVLCSHSYKDWFLESNIQEGLMGSDHCPVYAITKDIVVISGKKVHIKDIMNPPGMFQNGIRLREWSAKDLLPMSARLIPEFDRRRNIRDMFAKKPSWTAENISTPSFADELPQDEKTPADQSELLRSPSAASSVGMSPLKPAIALPMANGKRPAAEQLLSAGSKSTKRTKSQLSRSTSTAKTAQPLPGQSSLIGFFKPRISSASDTTKDSTESETPVDNKISMTPPRPAVIENGGNCIAESPSKSLLSEAEKPFSDPFVAKESWSKLLSKRVAPRCEHDEPCISLLTKKAGVNCGRSFYICPRPLGPSGAKEKGTEWRCGTFIWSSDWSGGEVANI